MVSKLLFEEEDDTQEDYVEYFQEEENFEDDFKGDLEEDGVK